MLRKLLAFLHFFLTVARATGTTTTSSSYVQEFWYSQPVDHFGFGLESTKTFRQRVFLDTSYVKDVRDGVPILVYFGGEASIETWLSGGGILTVAASHFHGLVVYIEHRFYGKSVPLGSIEMAMLDTEVRGCFTSVQALADFAKVIRSVKTDLKVPNSPVIVFGGSYAGMLAAWFRLKYPHVAAGALASSAPILASEDLPFEDQYCTLVSKDFKAESELCYERVSKSWSLIDDMASSPNGLDILSQTFKTCSPLFAGYQLKHYLAHLYNYVAQYNGRFNALVGRICAEISRAPEGDILGGISRGIFSLTQDQVCNNITFMSPASGSPFVVLDPASARAWDWQWCTELAPRQGCENGTMFETRPFDLSWFTQDCYERYGVRPHSDWISTYYGGQDLKTALKNFASNIIFSNGLKDPLSGASIQQDISDTVVAITTKQGSHCLDVAQAKEDDPSWLKRQRKRELDILAKWVKEASRSSSNRSVGHLHWGIWFVFLVGFYLG